MASEEEPAEKNSPQSAGLELRAELDVPGETGRQARVFALWFACLLFAVVAASRVGAHIPAKASLEQAEEELARSRAAKAKVAFLFGLLLPALLTAGLNYRYRRGGAHASGIIIDVTEEGELRIWGRGYGSRLVLSGAQVGERLVDVYAGRLGAWRQRRLRVRSKFRAAVGVAEMEFATPANAEDSRAGLSLEGGEGDCVELARPDYDRLCALVMKEADKEKRP